LANDLTPAGPKSAIEAFVEKLNLPEMIAGPAGKAISRLVAGAVEIPAAYLDSFAQSIKDKTEAKTLVNKEVASAAAKLAAGDSDIVARAAHNLLAKEYRHQKNKEDIARRTIEILQEETKALPAPDQQVSASPGPVDDDWLNVFEQYAEKASNARMQDLWARILAGEIRSPKAFSLKTLRFVSELDQETAKLFEKYAPFICNREAIPTPDELEGETLDELLHLQESGLLSGVGGLISQIIELSDDGKFVIINQSRGIFILGKPQQKINLKCALLTKTGIEIAKLIKIPYDPTATQEIVMRIPKGGIELIARAKFKTGTDDKTVKNVIPGETLWASKP